MSVRLFAAVPDSADVGRRCRQAKARRGRTLSTAGTLEQASSRRAYRAVGDETRSPAGAAARSLGKVPGNPRTARDSRRGRVERLFRCNRTKSSSASKAS